jgi:EpsI family protein
MKRGTVNYYGTVAMLALTLTLFKLSDQRLPQNLAKPLETISNEIDGWVHSGTTPLDDQTLRILHPTSYLSRSYRKRNRELGLFIAFYAQQRAGESMHSPKNCLPGSGWEIWKSGRTNILVAGRSIRINKYFIQNAGQRLIVYYWYQSRDRVVADEYLGKLLLIRDTIADASTAAALVRVTVADEPETSDEALRFSAAVIPEVQSCIGRHIASHDVGYSASVRKRS